MPSVPGEFDATYGLADDEKAAVAALANDDPKKKPEESDDEREDREREEAERKRAADEAGADETAEQEADAEQDEIEQQARSMGWVPKDEFKGNADKWKPAAEWLERGFANPYILKSLNDRLAESNKRQAAELAEVKKRLDESTLVIRDIHKRFEASDLNGYNRAVRQLKAQQKEAVGEADTEKFDKATEDLAALEKAGPPKPLVVETEAERPANGDDRQQQRVDAEIVEWNRQNAWFNQKTDPELFDYATFVDKQILREYDRDGKKPEEISARGHLDEVARRVKERYPDRFKNENPRRSAPSSVRTPGGETRGTNGRGNGKPANLQRTYANLPQDAKEACDRAVRSLGMKKDGKTPWLTREQWCEKYDWPQEFY